jgi:lipopolysaccharide heptosyltransferase I
MKSGAVSRILVVKPSSLGDILHVFPALELLKRHYSDAELDFLINPEFDPLLDFSPFPVSRRIHFERRKLAEFFSGPAEFFKLVRALRKEKYDLVVDFQGLFRSAFFAWIARRRRGSVCGFAFPREKAARFFYDRRVETKSLHAVEKNVELANFVTGASDEVPAPEFPSVERAALLPEKASGPRIVVFPGARWPSKCFPAELFSDVMRRIKEGKSDAAFIISGSAAERPKAAALLAGLPQDFPVTDMTGRSTLQELFGLIRSADAVLCNDSGPMHIAALLKTPVFSFFGPTDPRKTGPWEQEDRVFRGKAECAPCMNKICPKTETLCHRIDPGLVSSTILEQICHKESEI